MSALLALMLAATAPSEAELGGAATAKERQGLHAHGQCTVNERPDEVRALLAMDFRTRDYGKALRRLMNSPVACRGVDIRRGLQGATPLMWAGSFADWLLRRDRMLDDLPAHTAYRPELPTIEARNAGELMALCVIRTNPQGTAALLRTEPATKEELAALKAVGPTLSACVPANSKSEFTRESLRALLALGAYRLTTHNAQGGSSKAEAAK